MTLLLALVLAQSQPEPEHRARLIVPTVIGGALIAGGGTCLGLSIHDTARLTYGDPTLTSQLRVNSLAQQGKALQFSAPLLLGAGVISILIGLLLTYF